MRGSSAIFFTSNEVGLDSSFFVFLLGVLWASVKRNGGRWDGLACHRHAPMTSPEMTHYSPPGREFVLGCDFRRGGRWERWGVFRDVSMPLPAFKVY